MNPATYHWQQLANGPRIALASLPTSQCAAVSIYVPAGSRDERDNPMGLAHFVEHMVFKGTQRRNATQLSLEIESVGGSLNACTTEDHTVYDGRGEADLLEKLCDVLGDMVWHSTFPAEEIDLERDVIGEEITMVKENPGDYIGDMISSALWSPHPLGNAISGTLESIDRIDRKTLAAFRDRHHFRKDVVIAVSGPFSMQQAIDAIAPHLPQQWLDAPAANPYVRAGKPGSLVEERDTAQLQLALAWHVPGHHHADRHALRLLGPILGESASSRLFQELREKRGLCYHIGSDLGMFYDTGTFEIVGGLDPESREESLACIRRELDALKHSGPTAEEFARAKRLLRTQGTLALESTPAQAAWAGEYLLDYGTILTPEEARAPWETVTIEDIQRVVSEYLIDENLAMAEIRPQG